MEENQININATVTGITEVVEMAQKLCEELERAQTMVNDLALSLEKLSLEVDV
jgi:hypothetical protein